MKLFAAARVAVAFSALHVAPFSKSPMAEARPCPRHEITQDSLAFPLNIIQFPGHFDMKRLLGAQTFQIFGHINDDRAAPVTVFELVFAFQNLTPGHSNNDMSSIAGLKVPFMRDPAATIVSFERDRVVLDTRFGTVTLRDGQVPTTNGQQWANTCDAGIFPDGAFPGFGVFCFAGAIPRMVDCGGELRFNLPRWVRVVFP